MSEPLIIVSGLPRSGTSLMMQILEAGGIAALTDHIRSADDDNPRGYFEWEAIKKVGQDHRVLEPATKGDKAIKVISTLLPKLPKAHLYKILFMERDLNEVVRSQQKMLTARGATDKIESDVAAIARLKAHNDRIIAWMKTAPHIDAMMVSHRKLFQDRTHEILKITTFLGQDRLLSSDKMANVVDPKLYRNREHQGLLARFSSFLR